MRLGNRKRKESHPAAPLPLLCCAATDPLLHACSRSGYGGHSYVGECWPLERGDPLAGLGQPPGVSPPRSSTRAFREPRWRAACPACCGAVPVGNTSASKCGRPFACGCSPRCSCGRGGIFSAPLRSVALFMTCCSLPFLQLHRRGSEGTALRRRVSRFRLNARTLHEHNKQFRNTHGLPSCWCNHPVRNWDDICVRCSISRWVDESFAALRQWSMELQARDLL